MTSATKGRSLAGLGPWVVVAASALVAIEYLDHVLDGRRLGFDFTPSFWEPWHAIRSGVNPYPDPTEPLASGNPFLYPPLPAELTLPLSWLSFDAAAAVFTVGLVLSAVVTLRVLEVRWSAASAIWLLSLPVLGAVVAGNATLLVILAVALTWRWRNRPVWAAAALTAGLVIKLFIWPMLIWLVFTRRYRAAVCAATATACLAVASWAMIGFSGMTDYPALLAHASDELGIRGLLAYALAAKAAGPPVALMAGLAVAGALLGGAWLRRDDERAAITLALLAALYATPIIWVHYLGLLVIPAAIYGGGVWAAVPLLWLARLGPAGVSKPSWLIVCIIAITGAVAARALAGSVVGLRIERPVFGAGQDPA